MTHSVRKATFLASLGAGLEYYDFIIYGMMASTLSTLFFHAGTPWTSLMKTFAVFAVGYLARPLGGVFFGMLGDTFGRKKAFSLVMWLMAFSTFCMGLLPVHAQVGPLAPCLLLLLRILQGISFGAELPGAITVVNEYAEKKSQGLQSGFVISSVSLGSTLATFILYLLVHTFSENEVIGWAWRLPFLLGGLLAVANSFIRKYLPETPEFIRLQEQRSPVKMKEPLVQLWKHHRKQVFCGIGLTFFTASLVIFALYLPSYLNRYYQSSLSDVYFAMTWGMIWSAISMPLCGFVADRFGYKRTFLCTCIGFLPGVFLLFALLPHNNSTQLVLFMVLYQTVISFANSSYFPLVTHLFKTSVRYTGIALCYNVAYSLMGCAPLLITSLIESAGTPAAGMWFLLGCAGLSLLASLNLYRKSTEI